jgi:hypothetical protein
MGSPWPTQASGITSTALNIGNAIGLAVFTVIAGIGTDGKTGQAVRAAMAHGEFLVVLLTAAAMIARLPDHAHPAAPRPRDLTVNRCACIMKVRQLRCLS